VIFYVLRYWPTMSETFVVREIAELTRRGVPVEVLALGRRRDPRAGESVEGLVVHRPPRGLALGHAALRSPPWLWTDKRALRVRWAARLLRRRGAERVHAHFAGEAAWFAAAVAERLGVRFSVTVHANDLFVERRGVPLGALLGRARPRIVIAAHHARYIAERFGLDSRVVHCGVWPERYRPGDPGTATRFVSVARDVSKKGLDTLAQAMREVPAVLRLVGDAHRHGGPRVLVGPLPAREVDAVLRTAMAFVLPCRIADDGDRDGIPVAMMEAMASGLPVVTTPVSGIPELVDDAVGWLVPPDDPRALAATLRAVLADPSARRAKGARARARIEAGPFTVARQVDGLLAAFAEGRE